MMALGMMRLTEVQGCSSWLVKGLGESARACDERGFVIASCLVLDSSLAASGFELFSVRVVGWKWDEVSDELVVVMLG